MANLTLVRNDALSFDTLDCTLELMKLAEKGQAVGIAVAVMYKGGAYVVHAAGECKRNPVYARGMVAALDEELGQLARYGNC